MHEAYHRALMAFPDEDVVIGSRFVAADALDGFKELDEVTPSPGRGPSARSGPGAAGSPSASASTAVRRKDVHRHRQRPWRLPRLRVVEAREDRRRPQGDVRADPRRRRLAGRLRVDDGRGPGQARQPLIAMGEFVDVVRRRRMTRAFDPRPIEPACSTHWSTSPPARRAPARPRAGTWWCCEGEETAAVLGHHAAARWGAARSSGNGCSTRR